MVEPAVWTDPTSLDLEGALAVVIGASEGIGAAIAVGLTRAGAAVVAAGRDQQRLSPTAERIAAVGGDARVETVDVRDPQSVAGFAERVLSDHGTPRVLINSMGGTLIKQLVDVEVDEWDNLHHTHLRGTWLSCKSFGPAMGEQGYGKIVNLSSVAALMVNRGRSVYSVAKAGLNSLTMALASEWGAHGVRVNALAPGTTRTPRAAAQLQREPQREQYLLERIPLGRIAVPDDMVGPALFLASPMSDFVTGHTLVVDGGVMTWK